MYRIEKEGRTFLCFALSVCFAFLFWFSPICLKYSVLEKLRDTSYPQVFQENLSKLNKMSLSYIESTLPSPEYSNLLYFFFQDGVISDNEKNFLSLIQKNYPNTYFSKPQAEKLFTLTNLKKFEEFFKYKISAGEIDQLAFSSDMLDRISQEIYPVNSNKIPILMYHSIEDTRVGITRESFLNQLNMLYENGFSTMKMEDYLNGDFSKIPEGRKPVILTFDDGWISQFRYLDEKGEKIDPACVVGTLESFSNKYPLFGKSAVFYLYMRIPPFCCSIGSIQQQKLWQKKVKYLIDNGFEIGNHTLNHKYFIHEKEQEIKKELDEFYSKMFPLLGKNLKHALTFAYPGGYLPDNKTVLNNYRYKGFSIKASVKASGGGAIVPSGQNNNLQELPRIPAEDYLVKAMVTQPFFRKTSLKIQIPKMFLSSHNLKMMWIKENGNIPAGSYILDNQIVQFPS